MVQTVLYHKNGVITEDRFKDMNAFQWLFHYIEIINMKEESMPEKMAFFDKLDDLETSVQAFYLLVDKTNASTLIDSLGKSKAKRREDRLNDKQENKVVKDTNKKVQDEDVPDLLSDEEKELWSFMKTQPTTMKLTEDMKKQDKYLLPKRSRQDILDAQKAKIVERSADAKKPKLGFGE